MISSYEKFLSPSLLEHLRAKAKPVTGVPGLTQIGEMSGFENVEAFRLMVQLFKRHGEALNRILNQRDTDRRFVDERTKACVGLNQKLNWDVDDAQYRTVIGFEDSEGRVVFGPRKASFFSGKGEPKVAPIPDSFRGPHVTLFGPPDDEKMCVNAMNAFHRKLKNEPEIITELVNAQPYVPFWGADDEDSKTPIRSDLALAGDNLSKCLQGSFRLANDKLSRPIKRIPGLALPSVFLFFEGAPIPLHLYDFCLHLWANFRNPNALVFYVPKLETVEESEYLASLARTAEEWMQTQDPKSIEGTIRFILVLENPRAIFQFNEIISALHPFFLGASLGWHDFLSSTARWFRHDPNYRIPAKADPDIVVKYIKSSHDLLSNVVGVRGGIKIGGMYGVLPVDKELFGDSFQVTLRGFFKDVITQFKRGLDGFWVAHPDFVRIGLAMVESWRRLRAGDAETFHRLIDSLLIPAHRNEIKKLLVSHDEKGLDPTDQRFPRRLIASDVKNKTQIKNNDVEEIRYNVFQSLQYLTDWLSGNGCVALPANILGVSVRIMDDLATAERSRWEVWHEIHHGRFDVVRLVKIIHEELHFIRKDRSTIEKRVQVKWDSRTEKWYPIATELLLQLMTAENPVEFATELLLPFTLDEVRNASHPLEHLREICPQKYALNEYVNRLHHYFEACGSLRFAETLGKNLFLDLSHVESVIRSFSLEEINEAAAFHGNIGEASRTLDPLAKQEQSNVLEESEIVRERLRVKGDAYRKKFGFKFLVSAAGKSAVELENILDSRTNASLDHELQNARCALVEITRKRLEKKIAFDFISEVERCLSRYAVKGVQIAVDSGCGAIQNIASGVSTLPAQKMERSHWLELASLSKTVASVFCIEYFREKKIPVDTKVNELLKRAGSTFRLKSRKGTDPAWADRVTIKHLLEHSALNLHYVVGRPKTQGVPKFTDYSDQIEVISEPGRVFHYSGAGFLVIEHVIESLEKKSIYELTDEFLLRVGVDGLSFRQTDIAGKKYACGFNGDGNPIQDTRLLFPAFAAGAMGSAGGMLAFLQKLTAAFHSLDGVPGISHDTAVQSLFGQDKGSREFMGTDMGLGIFTLDAGMNRLMVHQGANDGFRCLFLYVFAGPDRNKGFVILCNGDDNAVECISDISMMILEAANVGGVNFFVASKTFKTEEVSPEERVNRGYKELLFSRFQPDLPEEIDPPGEPDPLGRFNLAVGAKVLRVSNQRFARAENLISHRLPTFDPTAYGAQGKIMDSWESARHNSNENDFVEIELCKKSSIRFISISTQFHLGNHAPFVSIDGKLNYDDNWSVILTKTPLDGHSIKKIRLPNPVQNVQYIRVSMHPDGGLSRLGLFDETLPDEAKASFLSLEKSLSVSFSAPIPQSKKPLTPSFQVTKEVIAENWARCKSGDLVDVASSAFGGTIESVSNEHYGPSGQVLSPFPPIHMFDGFESARSREPDHFETLVIRLGKTTVVEHLEMDFTYFKNNAPNEIQVEGFENDDWVALVPRVSVKEYSGNRARFSCVKKHIISKIRVTVFPDGGIHRIRAFSRLV